MFSYTKFIPFVMLSMLIGAHSQETHQVVFDNGCGRGTPTLVSQNGQILGTGNGPFTFSGPLVGAVAYLQTGGCGLNGDGCTIVETTLKNPTSPGAGSATDISLIAPHTFSVTSGFGYFNGCDGAGADCTDPNCPQAFHDPTCSQGGCIVSCQANNVNLAITFCE